MSDKKPKPTKAELIKMVKLLKKRRRRRRIAGKAERIRLKPKPIKKQIKQKQQVKQSVVVNIGSSKRGSTKRGVTKQPIKQPTIGDSRIRSLNGAIGDSRIRSLNGAIIRAPTNIIRPPPSYSTFDSVGNRQNVNPANNEQYQRQLRERAERIRQLEREREENQRREQQQREQQRKREQEREEAFREEMRRRQQHHQQQQQQQQQQLKRLHDEFDDRLRRQEREIVEAVGKQSQEELRQIRLRQQDEIRRYQRRIAQLEKDIEEEEEEEVEEFIMGSGGGKPVHPEQNIAIHTQQQDHNIGHHGDISSMSEEVRKLRRDMSIANTLGGGFPMVEIDTDEEEETDEEADAWREEALRLRPQEGTTSVSQSQTASAVPIVEASVIEPITLTQEILSGLNVGRLVEITKEINKSRPRGQKLTTSGPRGGHKTKLQLINQLIGLKISPEWL